MLNVLLLYASLIITKPSLRTYLNVSIDFALDSCNTTRISQEGGQTIKDLMNFFHTILPIYNIGDDFFTLSGLNATAMVMDMAIWLGMDFENVVQSQYFCLNEK